MQQKILNYKVLEIQIKENVINHAWWGNKECIELNMRTNIRIYTLLSQQGIRSRSEKRLILDIF